MRTGGEGRSAWGRALNSIMDDAKRIKTETEIAASADLVRRAKGPSRMEMLAQNVTPIFDEEMGHRLCIARMAMQLDQGELARDLGLNQGTVSKIESGRSRGSRSAIPLAHWERILGKHAAYVFYGTNRYLYDEAAIKRRFWERRPPGRSKPEQSDKKRSVTLKKNKATTD